MNHCRAVFFGNARSTLWSRLAVYCFAGPADLSASACSVTGLVPNDAYMFAYVGYDSAGQPMKSLSGSTPPILAASPLPLCMLWAQLAVDAARVGELSLARRAAATASKRWLTIGPARPLPQRSPAALLALRKEEVARTPRPLLYGLVRSLCVLSDTCEGGAGIGPSSLIGGDPRSVIGPAAGQLVHLLAYEDYVCVFAIDV